LPERKNPARKGRNGKEELIKLAHGLGQSSTRSPKGKMGKAAWRLINRQCLNEWGGSHSSEFNTETCVTSPKGFYAGRAEASIGFSKKRISPDGHVGLGKVRAYRGQRKERSQEDAGFLLARRGVLARGVPMWGGTGPSPRAGGSNLSLSLLKMFAGPTSSHPRRFLLSLSHSAHDIMQGACQRGELPICFFLQKA
jgi:hypothetical protein